MPIIEPVSIIDFKGIKPQIHETAFLASGCRIVGDVTIGAYSSIWFNAVIRGDVNKVIIGKETNIQDQSMIHVTHNGLPTIIGDRVTVGHMVMLHACQIGNRSLIGMGAIILDGAEIGESCLVGAGSLVTQGKKFPAGSMIMGSPATIKRALTQEEIDRLDYSASHYVNVMNGYLKP